MAQQLSTHGIGASEIAALCGLSPYASPWDIWLRKTGQAPDVATPQAEWGHRLEPAIRQAYADATGAVVEVPRESLFHGECSWARATPDGIAHFDDGAPLPMALVQCKNVGYWAGKDWEDGVPVYVQLQEQWEMFVTGLHRADVPRLIGGSDFQTPQVHRDEKIITDLVTIADAFWKRVQRGEAPPVDDSKACADHFRRRLARAGAVTLEAGASLEKTLEEWREARSRLVTAEKDVKRLRAVVSSRMAEAGASRVSSSLGTAYLARQAASVHRETNWRLVAELGASPHMTRAEFEELVAANTVETTTEESVSLREPANWSKERR